MLMDEVTQQNAALVEQSAAAAESLLDEASRLDQMMAKYKVGSDAPAERWKSAGPGKQIVVFHVFLDSCVLLPPAPGCGLPRP